MKLNQCAKAAMAGLAFWAVTASAHAATFVNGQGVTINTTTLGKLTSAEQVRVGSGLYRVDFGDALPTSLAFTDAAKMPGTLRKRCWTPSCATSWSICPIPCRDSPPAVARW